MANPKKNISCRKRSIYLKYISLFARVRESIYWLVGILSCSILSVHSPMSCLFATLSYTQVCLLVIFMPANISAGNFFECFFLFSAFFLYPNARIDRIRTFVFASRTQSVKKILLFIHMPVNSSIRVSNPINCPSPQSETKEYFHQNLTTE